MVGNGKKARGKKKPGTHVKRCVSMAVRLPNGRSPRQPLRTLCSLPPARPFAYLSLYSSIYPSTGPPHSLHPSHASGDPHHSTSRFDAERGCSRVEISDKLDTMGLLGLLAIAGIPRNGARFPGILPDRSDYLGLVPLPTLRRNFLFDPYQTSRVFEPREGILLLRLTLVVAAFS